MNYYRLMKSQAYFEFSGNQPIELADQPDIVPYGAKHIWIPAGNGDEISAWLVTPKGKFLLQDDCFPIVVMAPGFGNQKDMGLLQFAEEFSEGGIAALMFDYRLFGGSSRRNSKMRNYVNPWHHVEDIVTVVNYIHSNKLESDNVDPKNIALWGAAYGGGHVIVAAEQLGSTMIKGIVAQAPFLDGRAAAWKAFRHGGVFRTIDFVTLAITDVLRNMIGMHPLYVKIISQNKTDISFITAKPQDLTEYYAKHPKKYLGGWENKAPARSFFSLSFYSPKNHVGNIEVFPSVFISHNF